MRMTVIAAVLVACGGPAQRRAAGQWQWSTASLTGQLSIVVGGDNPSENVTGTLTIDDAAMPVQGRASETDGLVTADAADGTRFYVIMFNINAADTLSGFFCTRTRAIPAAQSDCETFSAAKR